MKRQAVTIVIDGVGVGALPDAARYGDEGANSLGSAARAVGGLRLETLGRLGLGNIISDRGGRRRPEPRGLVGTDERALARARIRRRGIGSSWAARSTSPFRRTRTGFPARSSGPSRRRSAAPFSGTSRLRAPPSSRSWGEEHIRTGRPIVYTSADSVFQIAAHEDVIPVRELYRLCLGGAEASRAAPPRRPRHRAAVHRLAGAVS